MRKMKTVTFGRADLIHVETALGIVNIYGGLRDAFGHRVERVEIIPNKYAGEPPVMREGDRLIEGMQRCNACLDVPGKDGLGRTCSPCKGSGYTGVVPEVQS